jgi:ketosteroid isomerase-like protein
MPEPRSPREVFHALVDGVCQGRWEELPELYAEQTDVVHPLDPFDGPRLRTRDDLREHFGTGAPTVPERRAVDIVVHETADPEVIVAEFAYEWMVDGEPFAGGRVPCIFVMRVRDGLIVESRDYADHIRAARIRGRMPELVTALNDSVEVMGPT